MSLQTLTAIAVLVAVPIAGQIERAPDTGTGVATGVTAGTCSLSLQGDQPVLATTIAVGGGTDVTVTASPGGGTPSVSAMAINTKGTGATNGRSIGSGTSCAARPSPGPTMSGAMRGAPPVATCAMSPDGSSASVSVPLSSFGGGQAKEFRGHVTLLKRGDGTVATLARDGWSAPVVVASCTAAGARSGYDLATLKKA